MSAPLFLNQFSKHYGSSRAVQDVSFELRKGEVFGFLGPNGAGKTTTIQSILDFIRPTHGSISIFGLDSVRESVRAKRYIGHYAGEDQLYSDLTGKQLLSYLSHFRATYKKDFMKTLVERLDVSLSTPIHKLSRGNRQKIGLLQALMHRPDLVILDEPTAGLDPLVKNTVYTFIEELQQNGVTFFISSHDLAEVQRICDRIGFIRDGQLIEVKDLDEADQLRIRHYTVTFAQPPQLKPFKELSSVSKVSREDTRMHAVVRGDIGEFLTEVSNHQPLDLKEHEMSLEEVFLTYYDNRE